MDEKSLKKYKLLKERNKLKIKEMFWKNNILFCECINSLSEYERLSLEETDILFEYMQDNFPISNYGCIDWEFAERYSEIKNIYDIYSICKRDSEWYILWNQADMPSISCKLEEIVENIDNILAVSFDTWLLSKDKSLLIEFYHEGKVVLGKLC